MRFVAAAALALLSALLLTLPMASAQAPAASLSPAGTSTTSVAINVAPPSQAVGIASTFWGLNVAAAQTFTAVDEKTISATPVNYIRFPGGNTGERYNYTSDEIIAYSGSVSKAGTSISQFIAGCDAIHCHSILQLPAEINKPGTAAFYVKYVVDQLKYHPSYWEIGNAPGAWTEYNVPWSEWGKVKGGAATPTQFATLLHNYIQAVRAVDPTTPIVAMGIHGAPKPWIQAVVSVDGPELAGITLHSYAADGGPSPPTLGAFYSNLDGSTSLPAILAAAHAEILAACPTCTHLLVFVSEINAAFQGIYIPYVWTFDGTLFSAAEVVQALTARLANLDFFVYRGDSPGTWETGPSNIYSQYYLYSDILTHLGTETLTTSLVGGSMVFAIATLHGTVLSILIVNVNTSQSIALKLGGAQFAPGSSLTEYYWPSGQHLPTTKSISETSSPVLPPLSLAVIQGPVA